MFLLSIKLRNKKLIEIDPQRKCINGICINGISFDGNQKKIHKLRKIMSKNSSDDAPRFNLD